MGKPTVADLDGDGIDEIVVSSFDGRAHCLASDGTWRWSTDIRHDEGGYHSSLIVDTSDGPHVIIHGMDESEIRCLDGKGQEVWRYEGRGAQGTHIGFAPVNISGALHIFVVYNRTGQVLLTADGREVWMKEYSGGDLGCFAPSVAYVDGDGEPELLLTRRLFPKLWVLDINGEPKEIAFDLMGADSRLNDALVILQWIKRKRLSSFTKRDCHAGNSSRFKNAADVQKALDILVERICIRPLPQPITSVGGRPSSPYEVNPTLELDK